MKASPKHEISAEHILLATFEMAATNGWKPLFMTDIARHLGVPPATLYHCFPTKNDLLRGLIRLINEQTLTRYGEGEKDSSQRDRLFDLLMCRFECMTPHKPAIKNIWRDLKLDPACLITSLGEEANSMLWMLELSEIKAEGLFGALKAHALGAIYLQMLMVWLEDDSADMAKTMAAVDQGLKRLSDFIPII